MRRPSSNHQSSIINYQLVASTPFLGHIVVIVAYLFITIFMTWPSILHLTDGVPGDGFDGWQNLWNLWWVKQAILEQGANPYFTTLVDAPNGVSLFFHTLNIFNGLWTLPIQLNFGLMPAYHAVALFSFVMAGYGGYLLALHSLSQFHPTGAGLRPAAFVGGLVFTMSPFHLAHLLGHMQVFSMVWPPFYGLWLLLTLQPWSTDLTLPPRPWRKIALASLFLILATLVDWYHTLYLLMFTGLVLVWTIWQRWRYQLSIINYQLSIINYPSLLAPLWLVLAIGLIFSLTLSPLLIPMLGAASVRPDLDTGLFQNVTLSADLLAYILPSEMHPLWGTWAKSIANNFSSTTSERLIFAGFVPLALALFIVIRRRSHKIVKFWALTLVVFVVLSLGPFLHINGQIVAIGGWQLPMPYLLLYYTVPFLNLTRSLSRYALMVMLSLGVLVAFALVQLSIINTQRAPRYQLSIINYQLSIITALLILFEFLPIPYPVSLDDTPQFYYDIGKQPDNYVIAELPMNWDRPTPLLHQTVHGKQLLTAYTSRANPLELASRTPVLQHWRNLGPDIIDQPLDQIAPTIFFDFNLRYIVLDYWQMPPGPERDSTEQWVAAALPGATPVYNDGRLKVYQSPPKIETQPYLSLGAGWDNRRQDATGLITRSFAAGASRPELFLHHPQGKRLTLEISATADRNNQTLAVFAEDEMLEIIPLKKEFFAHLLHLPPTDAPFVRLKFQAGKAEGQIIISRVGLSEGEKRSADFSLPTSKSRTEVRTPAPILYEGVMAEEK
jgi:hypothetical protein